MSVKDFVEIGLLQEVNRQFLHPMGLALEVVIDDDGTYKFGEIWDYRDDEEGMLFGKDITSKKEFAEKARRVSEMFYDKAFKRIDKFGNHIQQVPKKYKEKK